jgi:small-conductance mechanosensitive channel
MTRERKQAPRVGRFAPAMLWLAMLWLAGWLTPAGAEDAAPNPTLTKGVTVSAVAYPVQLGGATVAEIRHGFKALTPARRAELIQNRLQRLADSGEPIRLRIEETEISSDLYSGDQLVMSVFDDEATDTGKTRADLAREDQIRIEQTVVAYQKSRGRTAMLTATIETGVTVAVALLALVLWGRLHRRIKLAILSRAEFGMAMLDEKTFHLVRVEHLRVPLLGALAGLRLLVWAAIIYTAVHLSLAYFPQTRAISDRLSQLVTEPLYDVGYALVSAIPKLLVLTVMFLVVRWLLRSSRFFFERVADGRIELEGFYPEWSAPTRRIVNLLIIIGGLMIAFPYIPGSDSAAFKGITIFLGVLLSLGSSGIVSNLMTGLSITYMRAFKVGDVVRIHDVLGTVVGSSLLVTRLRTPKGLEITLPNSLVLSGQMINYSASGSPLLTTTVTIGYDAPWRQVEAMLLQAASRTGGVKTDPAPMVTQAELGDFYVRYDLNVAVADMARQVHILSELHQHILDVFNEYGVQIMSPHFEMQPDQQVLVPRSKWFSAPARPGRE